MPLPAPTRTHRARILLSALLALSPLAAYAQEPEANGDLGRQVFTNAEPPCAVCHALSDAGAAGRIGPNLDRMMPAEERVRAAVTGGVGIMPAYKGMLSEEEIDAVSKYVATVAGQQK